ncbi:MAG: methylated-DNA--[protein]-cysteine S-methyltransferase [Muribaculaceae bacterium]|nr:methylated-DNA--[protein]-cysteine S-methyltransferase [Muribaculaceae bacterium]
MAIEKRLETRFGTLILISRKGKLTYCGWDSKDSQRKYQRNKCQEDAEPCDVEVVEKAATQLKEYLRGERQIFDLPLDPMGTEFQRRVWSVMAEIPFGGVATYKSLAKKCGAGKSFRALAQACGSNPLSIIFPCHRVVAVSGLGGYTGGLDKKESLLKLEREVVGGINQNL